MRAATRRRKKRLRARTMTLADDAGLGDGVKRSKIGQ